MKKLCILLLAIFTVLQFAGCVPTERSDLNIAPDMEGKGTAGIDFIQLNNDTLIGFSDTEPYAYITFVDIDGNEAKKKVTAVVGAMEDEEGARYFSAALLKNIASAANVQNSNFTEPGKNDFGNFWDTYAADFRFFRSEDIGKEGAVPFYEYTLAAGEKSELDPDTEAYEEEYHRLVELLKRNEGVK